MMQLLSFRRSDPIGASSLLTISQRQKRQRE
jgi:hypothetical protein